MRHCKNCGETVYFSYSKVWRHDKTKSVSCHPSNRDSRRADPAPVKKVDSQKIVLIAGVNTLIGTAQSMIDRARKRIVDANEESPVVEGWTTILNESQHMKDVMYDLLNSIDAEEAPLDLNV